MSTRRLQLEKSAIWIAFCCTLFFLFLCVLSKKRAHATHWRCGLLSAANCVANCRRFAVGLLLGQLLAMGLVAGASFVSQFNPRALEWLKVLYWSRAPCALDGWAFIGYNQ
jgi:hypothetical protein